MRDPIGDLLSANGLSGYEGEIKVIHRHSDACYADGILICPLVDSDYMAGYPNVRFVEDFAGDGSGSNDISTGSVGDYYVVGMPGGYKETGETTDGSNLAEHVHGPACGDGCTLDVVIRYIASEAAGRLSCGKMEHVHGEACLAKEPEAPAKTPTGISGAFSWVPRRDASRRAGIKPDNRTISVRVEYPSVKRDTAEVIYTIPGRSTGIDVIAMIDTSVDNRDAMADLKSVMSAGESLRWYISGTSASTTIYDNQATYLGGVLESDFKRLGMGQSNQVAALDSMLSQINSTSSNRVPVVFWALSPDEALSLSTNGNLDIVKSKLAEVQAALVAKGGQLITWQRGDHATEWLEGDNTSVNFAPANTFKQAATDSLKAVVADWVENCKLTLTIPAEIDMVTGIQDGSVSIRRWDYDYVYDYYRWYEGYTSSVSGRTVTISIPKFYNSTLDTEISFILNLDTKKNALQRVSDGFTVTGDYKFGIFNETAVYPSFPGFDLDRVLRTISFKNNVDSGPEQTISYTGLPGESILAPDGSPWSTGEEFSGWVNTAYSNAVLRAGEETKFAEESFTMTALWGHIELGLYLGDVTQGGEPGNQMYPGPLKETALQPELYTEDPNFDYRDVETTPYWKYWIDEKEDAWHDTLMMLRSKFLDIGVELRSDIASFQVLDERLVSSGKPFDIVTVKGGINGGEPNGVYIGLDGANPVVMYVTGSAGNYSLYLSGIGGVTAPYSIAGLLDDSYSFNYNDPYEYGYGDPEYGHYDHDYLAIEIPEPGYVPGVPDPLVSVDFSKLNFQYVTNMSSLFKDRESLTAIIFGVDPDTSHVTTMSSMFNGCRGLSTVDLSCLDVSSLVDMSWMFAWTEFTGGLNFQNIDTSRVTNMAGMFEGIGSKSVIDLSRFDTSSVTNMNSMFEDCKLPTLDLSHLNTNKVTSMAAMFDGCSTPVINVSNFNTSSVTTMSGMFRYSRITQILGLENFDTSNVKSMYEMFRQSEVSSLNLSHFDTSNVTTMYWMFFLADELLSVDVSHFNTSKVTTMEGMFDGCSKLSSITGLSYFNTSKVTNMNSMFEGCRNLSSIDVSHFDTSNVTNMGHMFGKCDSLSSLNLSNFDTAKVTSMANMFDDCDNLRSITFGAKFTTANVKNMSFMFAECPVLSSVDVSKFNTSNVTGMRLMFAGCKSLSSLDLSSFDTSFVTKMQGMFAGCSGLRTLNLGSNFSTVKVTEMGKMFENCSSLSTLNLGTKFDTSKVTDFRCMFHGCTGLSTLALGSSFYLSGVLYGENRDYDFDIGSSYSYDYSYGMFENCYNLRSVDGLKWKNDATISTNFMKNMFKNCQNLGTVSLPVAQVGQKFPNLSDLTSMFEGCTVLTSVDLSGWVVPNVSHMNNMFYNAGSGRTLIIKMTWSGLTGSTISTGTIASASYVNLYIGDYVKDGSVEYNQKKNIITAFVNAIGTSRLVAYNSSNAAIALNSLAIVTPTGMFLSVERQGSSIPSLPSNEKIDYTDKIPTYADSTPVGTKVPYVIRVAYVGDAHGLSGVVDIRYPLPKGVAPDPSIPEESAIELGVLEGFSSKDNVVPGKEFKVTGDAESGYVLTGALKDIPAGSYIDVTVKCVLDLIDDSTKEVVDGKDRWTWTGTAYSSSNSGAASSNPLRMWFSYEDDVVQPDQSYASVSFQYVGDVPTGVPVPEAGTYATGESVQMDQPVAPFGYEFDGWYLDNAGTKVASYSIGTADVDGGTGVVFYGRWSVSAEGMNKLTYRYDDTAPSTVDVEVSTSLKPGVSCSIFQPAEVYGYSFDGWKDVLVDGEANDVLAKSGTLDTSSLGAGKEIVYIGGWRAHTVTIRFLCADTGEEAMEPLSVRIVDPQGELPAFDAAPLGWSTSPDGLGDPYAAGTPLSSLVGRGNLLANDGDELVLYAIAGSTTPLPKTGGSGTMVITLAGVVLLTAAGIVAVGASRGKRKDPEPEQD